MFWMFVLYMLLVLGQTTATNVLEENNTLKETIFRLNKMLSEYQAKYKPPSKQVWII